MNDCTKLGCAEALQSWSQAGLRSRVKRTLIRAYVVSSATTAVPAYLGLSRFWQRFASADGESDCYEQAEERDK